MLNFANLGIDEQNRGEIACLVDAAGSCSCCEIDDLEGMCNDVRCPGMFIQSYELIELSFSYIKEKWKCQ